MVGAFDGISGTRKRVDMDTLEQGRNSNTWWDCKCLFSQSHFDLAGSERQDTRTQTQVAHSEGHLKRWIQADVWSIWSFDINTQLPSVWPIVHLLTSSFTSSFSLCLCVCCTLLMLKQPLKTRMDKWLEQRTKTKDWDCKPEPMKVSLSLSLHRSPNCVLF